MMPKSNIIVFAFFFIAAWLSVATPAFAQQAVGSGNGQIVIIDADNNVCPAGSGFTERVVNCIRGVMIYATTTFMLPFSIAMSNIVRILCTLAVIFFGFKMMVGRQQKIQQDGAILLIKLSFVIVFSWNFGGMFYAIIDIMDWLVQVVSSYIILNMPLSCSGAFSLWQRIDCAVDKLIGGVLPQSELSYGILGLLFGSIFSGPTGFAMFLIGLAFVFTLLLAIIQAVFIFLNAFIALAILIIISPMIVPLILFRETKAYFEKWLKLLLGAMLQPIFLFAYVSMLLAAFDVTIYSGPKSVYRTIAGISAADPNFRIGAYMVQAGAYVERSELPVSITLETSDLSRAAIGPNSPRLDHTGTFGAMEEYADDLSKKYQSFIGKNIGADVRVQAVDYQKLARINGCQGLPANSPQFKSCYTNYVIRVIMSLLMACIIAYIFRMMLQFVPYLSGSLAGGMTAIPQQLQSFANMGVGGIQNKLAGPKPQGMPEAPKSGGILPPAPVPHPGGK